jgi:heat shock protein HslJ
MVKVQEFSRRWAMNPNVHFIYRHAIPFLAPVALLVAACVSEPRTAALPPVPDLAGTHWTVTAIDGRGPLRSGELTADFGVDGRVNGDSGCNRFSGPFVQSGSTVNFGELLSTRRACAEDTRQRQEDRLLDIMRGATTAQWVRDELRLRGRAGTMTLVRADSTNAAYVDENYGRRVRYQCQGVVISVDYGETTARVTSPDEYEVLQKRPLDDNGVQRYEGRHSELRFGRDILWGREGAPPRSCVELR